jgi:integrase
VPARRVDAEQVLGLFPGHWRLPGDLRLARNFDVQVVPRLQPGRRQDASGGEAPRAREAAAGRTGHRRQTVEKYLDWWLRDIIAGKRAAKTEKTYRDTVRLHLVPELGPIELGKLAAQHVDALLAKREKAGLSPLSVAYIRAVLSSALSTAVRKRMLEFNAAKLAETPRQAPQSARRVLTADEAKKLLLHVQGDRVAAPYRMALTLGLRQGEIIGLRWIDLDLDGRSLRVQQTIQRVGETVHVQEPETSRSKRTLPLTDTLVTVLKAHRDVQAIERRQAEPWQESGLVFTSTVGMALDGRNLTRQFKQHLPAAELPEEIRFYDQRHTAASLLLADNVPLLAVSQMLEHALTSTTLNTYAHLLPGTERVTADAMERLWDSYQG